MKKMLLVLIFVLLFVNSISSQISYEGIKYSYTDEPGFVTITENEIIFEDRYGKEELIQSSEKGVLTKAASFDLFESETERYIILNIATSSADFLTLVKQVDTPNYRYESWGITYSESKSSDYTTIPSLAGFNVLKAESYITEEDSLGNIIQYVPENSNIFDVISNPWAVSANSKDKIIIVNSEKWRNPRTKYQTIDTIVFINGFVNPEKPHLFYENARAKTIKISYGDVSFEVELNDTGNYQAVSLPTPINPRSGTEIKVEIIDSYEGTKYSDIVISGMLYIDAGVEK